jgi:hypothetical protein
MARHQDRNWYILPQARPMIWEIGGQKLDVMVIAFTFDADTVLWLTIQGTVIENDQVWAHK